MGAAKYEFRGIPEQPQEVEVLAARNLMRTTKQFDAAGEERPEFAAALAVVARRQAFLGIYEDLQGLGHRVPSASAATITAGAMAEHLRAVLGDVVRREIEEDPDDIYPDELVAAAASGNAVAAAELARLLNVELAWEEPTTAGQPWRSSPAEAADHRRSLEVAGSSKPFADRAVSHPIARALRRFPHGPALLTADDVLESLKGS